MRQAVNDVPVSNPRRNETRASLMNREVRASKLHQPSDGKGGPRMILVSASNRYDQTAKEVLSLQNRMRFR